MLDVFVSRNWNILCWKLEHGSFWQHCLGLAFQIFGWSLWGAVECSTDLEHWTNLKQLGGLRFNMRSPSRTWNASGASWKKVCTITMYYHLSRTPCILVDISMQFRTWIPVLSSSDIHCSEPAEKPQPQPHLKGGGQIMIMHMKIEGAPPTHWKREQWKGRICEYWWLVFVYCIACPWDFGSGISLFDSPNLGLLDDGWL